MSFELLKNLAFLEAMIMVGYAIFFVCLGSQLRREIGFKPLFLFGGLAAACFVAPNLWVLHLLFLGTVPLLARTREQVGLVLLVALLATPGLTLDLHAGTVPIFGLTAQGSMALGAFAAMLARPHKDPKLPFIADLPALLVLILLVVVGASDTTFTHWLRQTAFIAVSWGLPYYVVTRTLSTPESIHRACIWLTSAASMLSVVVLYERASFWPFYTALNDKYGIVRGPLELIVKMREGLLRAEGPMGEATAMGFILVVGLAAAIVSHRAFRSRMGHWAIVALIGFGLLAPQSRGGWLGAAVALVAIGVFRRRRAGAVTLALALLGVGALSFRALNRSGGSSVMAGSGDYRAQLWWRGLEEFRERPLLGDSYRDVVAQMPDLIQGEGMVDFVNSYLYFALLVGSVGIVMFVAFFVIPLVRIWLARQNLGWGSPGINAGAFCFGALVSAAIMFSLTSFIPRAALLVIIASGFAGTLSSRRLAPAPKPTKLHRAAESVYESSPQIGEG